MAKILKTNDGKIIKTSTGKIVAKIETPTVFNTIYMQGRSDGEKKYKVNGSADYQTIDHMETVTLHNVTNLVCYANGADGTSIDIGTTPMTETSWSSDIWSSGIYGEDVDVTSHLQEGCYVTIWARD